MVLATHSSFALNPLANFCHILNGQSVTAAKSFVLMVPVCASPIFSYFSLVLTSFKLVFNPGFDDQDEILPLSPILTSLYFCGPWCLQKLFSSDDESCLRLKEIILDCNIRVQRYQKCSNWELHIAVGTLSTALR